MVALKLLFGWTVACFRRSDSGERCGVLGTGHYLPPGAGGGRGDHLIFRRTKGGISQVTKNPKGGGH